MSVPESNVKFYDAVKWFSVSLAPVLLAVLSVYEYKCFVHISKLCSQYCWQFILLFHMKVYQPV